jgi:PhnB protein
MPAKPVPKGFRTVTPYLVVEDAARQIEFLSSAFDAEVTFILKGDDGSVLHAEVKVGDSMLMIGQPAGEWKVRPMTFYLYVSDCDAMYKRAVSAGGSSLQEPTNQFYGDRQGGIEDAAGNHWWIATHIEDVAAEEMTRRMRAQAPTR